MFSIFAAGAKLAFPDMIVPFGWALAVMGIGATGLVTTAFFAIKWALPDKQTVTLPVIRTTRLEAPTKVPIANNTEVKSFEASLAPLLQERQHRLKTELVDLLQTKKLPRPTSERKWSGAIPAPFQINRFGELTGLFQNAGLQVDIDSVVSEAHSRVNASAIYCTIPSNEVGLWRDEKSIQEWHRHNEAVDALIKEVGL